MALPKKTAAPAPVAEGVNFLTLDFYTGGGGLQEGDYVWEKVDIVMHSGFDATRNSPSRLGVMIKLKNLHDLKEEVRPIFTSMGSKAHLSFAPNATGKGLMPIPGAPATTLPQMTNWEILFKSMIDCDPNIQTIATNDVSIFEGMWCHMQSIPEPDERKGFGAGAVTGETSGQPQGNAPKKTPVVTHILDEGKPWEGGGGIPATSPFAGKTAAKPVTVTPKAAAKVAEPIVESADDDVRAAANAALSDMLEKQPNGGSRLLVRNAVFKYSKEKFGDDMAQAVLNTYFSAGTDDALDGVLGELGYTIQANQIKLME